MNICITDFLASFYQKQKLTRLLSLAVTPSSALVLNSGAPQGGVFRPLLFTLHALTLRDDTNITSLITNSNDSSYQTTDMFKFVHRLCNIL